MPHMSGGGEKSYLYLVNVGSTKSHYNENLNIRILPKEYNHPSFSMESVTQNEFKSFVIVACVTIFGMNNLEFNRKVVSSNNC